MTAHDRSTGAGQPGSPKPRIKHPLSKKHRFVCLLILGKAEEGKGKGWGQGGVDSGSIVLSFSRMSVMGKPGGVSGLVQRQSRYLGWEQWVSGWYGSSGKAARYSHTARQTLKKQGEPMSALRAEQGPGGPSQAQMAPGLGAGSVQGQGLPCMQLEPGISSPTPEVGTCVSASQTCHCN